MKSNLRKLLTGLLVGVMLLGTIPAYAADPDITIIVEDITADDETTVKGEAKFKISAEGITDRLTYAEIAASFSSDTMEFQRIEYIHNAENAVNVNLSMSEIKATKKIKPGFACATSPITSASGKVDMFIVVFGGGSEGDTVTLNVDISDSELGIAKEEHSAGTSYAPNRVSGDTTATASTKDNAGVNAKINLSMSNVPSYAGTDAQHPITLTLTNKAHNKVYTEKLTKDILEFGSVPTFKFSKRYIAGTYDIEISADGYKTYTKKNFDISNELNISTNEFMPGDVNGDGKIDFIDYTIFMSAFDGKLSTHTFLIDFDRNGSINKNDLDAIKASLVKEVVSK